MIDKEETYKAPEKSGIYYLYSKRKKLVYIGKARNIKIRLRQHYHTYNNTLAYIKGKSMLKPNNYQWVKPFQYFRFTLVKDLDYLDLLELDLIQELKPRYNQNSYIMIKRKDRLYMKSTEYIMDIIA